MGLGQLSVEGLDRYKLGVGSRAIRLSLCGAMGLAWTANEKWAFASDPKTHDPAGLDVFPLPGWAGERRARLQCHRRSDTQQA